jgi:hypothetical protein
MSQRATLPQESGPPAISQGQEEKGRLPTSWRHYRNRLGPANSSPGATEVANGEPVCQ